MKAEIEWIPVTERLPGVYVTVLVTFDHHYHGPVTVPAIIDTQGLWRGCGHQIPRVTAWAELPAPYNPNTKEADDEV